MSPLRLLCFNSSSSHRENPGVEHISSFKWLRATSKGLRCGGLKFPHVVLPSQHEIIKEPDRHALDNPRDEQDQRISSETANIAEDEAVECVQGQISDR